jgi:hypothetical protein
VLLIENQKVKDEVNSTSCDVGPVPIHNGALRYLPSYALSSLVDAGKCIFLHGTKSVTTNINRDSSPVGETGVFALPLLLSVKGLDALGKSRRRTSSVFQGV